MKYHNNGNGILGGLLDAVLQWRIAAVVTSDGRHGEGKKARFITNRTE